MTVCCDRCRSLVAGNCHDLWCVCHGARTLEGEWALIDLDYERCAGAHPVMSGVCCTKPAGHAVSEGHADANVDRVVMWGFGRG